MICENCGKKIDSLRVNTFMYSGLEFATMDRARDALLETCAMLEEWISASKVESWSEEQDG